jgi:hypothetical protein
MKYLALIPLVFVASCASRPQPVFSPLPSPPTVQPVESVRYPEVVRAYHVGRYVDPNHPETMQEEHPVNRVEVSGHWNLHPGSIAAPLLNPPPDAAFAPPLTNDVLVAELNRQRETTALVMQQAARLTQSFDELQKIFTEMKKVARDNAVFGARLAKTEERLAGFEKELQKITAATPSPTNNVPATSAESPQPLSP